MTESTIGILDVGKTHTRFLQVDACTGEVVHRIQRPSGSLDGPVRQLDVAGIENWLLEVLASSPRKQSIRTLVPIAHGAAGVLVDREGQVVSAPDYEDPTFESVGEAYQPLRDTFEQTYSPFLPLGLNLGRQLFYLQTKTPDLFARARQLLLYPQFWSWRLSGVASSELTSLGCHSDLWRPLEKRPSELSRRRGWDALLPPQRRANDALGVISPQVAAATGLDPACRVACGIHDSNASFLPHMIGRSPSDPFAVISSGTWTVVMASGSAMERLDEAQDMLLNIDALGRPVATARFMGGREFEDIVGKHSQAVATEVDLETIIEARAFALPSLVNAAHLNARERMALAVLYVALRTDYLLDVLDARGDLVVDGPLGRDRLFGGLLAALRNQSSVCGADGADSCSAAGRWLAGCTEDSSMKAPLVTPFKLSGLREYRGEWRRRYLE